MKLILYQATITITEIDFVPGPFRCQIELGHLDFAVVYNYTFFIFSPADKETPSGFRHSIMHRKRVEICTRENN